MMKNLTYLVLLLLSNLAIGQQNIEEKVYLHLNTDQLIVGETLHFSAYCQSAETGKLSTLSKILYVELVGDKGAVFQSKITLENGRGEGQYFVSSLLSTGRYQLLAYTRWMKNFESHYQTPVIVINPYEEYEIPNDSNNLEIAFFPATEKLVTEVENTVAFRITNSPGPEAFGGKIVNQNGEKILEFSADKYGLGRFSITPKKGSSYQAIIEDVDGNFHFNDLPASRPGTTMTLEDSKYFLEINLSTYPEADDTGKLIIKSLNNELHSEIVSLNHKTRIQKSNLGNGPITIDVYNISGTLLASRLWLKERPELNITDIESSYETRSKVLINKELPDGTYSVSIRKKSLNRSLNTSSTVLTSYHSLIEAPVVDLKTIFTDDQSDLEAFLLCSGLKPHAQASTNIQWLPEYRNELVSGKVLEKSGKPVANAPLALAFPANNSFQTRTAKTAIDGTFTIPFVSCSEDSPAYLTCLDSIPEYAITLDPTFLTTYPDFNYQLKPLDSILIRDIVERSIRNQLHNTYYTSLQGSDSSNWLPQVPFDIVYKLDDYTRFQTLKETFIEYIPGVSVRDYRYHKIKPLTDISLRNEQKAPLILLDGIPVPQEEILSFSPYKIDEIGILNNRYFLGSYIADGVVCLKTKPGNLEKFDFPKSYHTTTIKKVHRSKMKKQFEVDPIESNMPDQRDQLLWLPMMNVQENTSQSIEFFTSDVTGTFELVIEGYTPEGAAFYTSETFNVVSHNN